MTFYLHHLAFQVVVFSPKNPTMNPSFFTMVVPCQGIAPLDFQLRAVPQEAPKCCMVRSVEHGEAVAVNKHENQLLKKEQWCTWEFQWHNILNTMKYILGFYQQHLFYHVLCTYDPMLPVEPTEKLGIYLTLWTNQLASHDRFKWFWFSVSVIMSILNFMYVYIYIYIYLYMCILM